jgi:hypothetical protein
VFFLRELLCCLRAANYGNPANLAVELLGEFPLAIELGELFEVAPHSV